jgi:hypothetical protein
MAPGVNLASDEFTVFSKQMFQIPWVTSNNPTLSYEEDGLYYTMYKITKNDIDRILDPSKLMLYLLLSSVFPRFLPQR